MTCHNCRSECRRFGKRKERQRYQCQQCRKVFTDARDNTLGGMYTSVEAATKALEMLLEGCSVSTVERLTNASSHKWENRWAAVSLWFGFYNFCRVHKSLRAMPAMAAGIADHIWTVRELLEAA